MERQKCMGVSHRMVLLLANDCAMQFCLINLFLAVVADEYTAQELSENETKANKIEEVKQSYLTDGYEIEYDLEEAAKEARERGDEEVFPDPWGATHSQKIPFLSDK